MSRYWAFIAHLVVLLALVWGTPMKAQQPGNAPEPRVNVAMPNVSSDALGQWVPVSFQVTANMPKRGPLRPRRLDRDGIVVDSGQYLPRIADQTVSMIVVSIPPTVRVKGKGFIVVPPGQRLPFNADFETDRLRLVFPLYLPESKNSGSTTASGGNIRNAREPVDRQPRRPGCQKQAAARSALRIS